MSKRFLISVAAIALMAGAGAANTQSMKNESGAATATSPAAPSTGAGAAPTRESAEPSKGAAHDMKSGQTEKSPGAMKSQRAEEPRSGGKDMKAEGRESNKAAETKSEKSQITGQAGGHEDNMKSEGRENNMRTEGREGNKAAETGKSTTEKSQTTGQAGAAAKLSTEQRTRITTVIRGQHVAPATNVNFSIRVGTRVPREGMRFYPLPAEVVTIYPEWRGYEFILVRDEILVIDPNTYEIVAVLNA
jgi:Protein of unknown function (DUF1236)